jgi:hypothetical protein
MENQLSVVYVTSLLTCSLQANNYFNVYRALRYDHLTAIMMELRCKLDYAAQSYLTRVGTLKFDKD